MSYLVVVIVLKSTLFPCHCKERIFAFINICPEKATFSCTSVHDKNEAPDSRLRGTHLSGQQHPLDWLQVGEDEES